MKKLIELVHDTSGDAVVEATILFPIINMIFAALVLLAIYLPTRAALQRATQYAATAIATEKSDTWLYFDEDTMSYQWETDKGRLPHVYVALFRSIFSGTDDGARARTIVEELEQRGISIKSGELEVEYGIVNYVIYKEVVVTAKRTIPVKDVVDLSFIGFPEEIPLTVTSTAVVQNSDEFVRNMDIAAELFYYVSGGTSISDVFESFGEFIGSILNFSFQELGC